MALNNTIVNSGGFGFSVQSVGGVWNWFVKANNIQGLGQLYQIDNIITPYGKFVDAQIPLPGDVVIAMASSLQEIQQQLAPLVMLLSGTPLSYSVTVTEGDPSTYVATVPFTNAGAFGSFLSSASTSDSSWLTAVPSNIVGIGKNQPAQIKMNV